MTEMEFNKLFAENLNYYMKKTGTSRGELAKLLGVSLTSVANWCNALKTPRMDKVDRICAHFGIKRSDLMSEKKHAPVFNVAAGEGILNEGYPSDEVRGILLEPDQFFATVHGRSMEPTLTDGDLVVIAASNVVDSPDQIALVKINGDEATLKHVEIREDGIVLIGDNVADYKPHFYSKEQVQQLPVTIEGVVVKLIREF